ncbi:MULTISPECIES: DUF2384 domain-containing protein [Roseobacteraceae]|jgi:hypothetical protein|uniref:DUF2384 domain-containing protein n=1 Tax=Roseobacteraceae TaxID=2854170 RepID=UPI000E777253|nr:DUF2384 domain-containing protein [Sulfitobacter sp. D7]AYE86126.1 hypothetical protein B5M07_08365 [Sulfitobacter sp. D7]
MDEQRTMQDIVLKAMPRLFALWKLEPAECAGLLSMTEEQWRQVVDGNYRMDLTEGQVLRTSALLGIYRSLEICFSKPILDCWISLPNNGPTTQGQRPVDAMIEAGLPKFLEIRKYLEFQAGP